FTYLFYLLYWFRRHLHLHSFPTRRSSDLTDIYYSPEKAEVTEPAVAKMITADQITEAEFESNNGGKGYARNVERELQALQNNRTDRKSTRLNSSHVKISYAVFCLKKKQMT